MTKKQLEEKMEKSEHDCTTCEFKVVPVHIEPCKSCDKEQDNWNPSREYLEKKS